MEKLIEVPIRTLDQAINILNAGMKFREMASQKMNLTSSRSHTILHVDVYQTKHYNDLNNEDITQ